VAEYEDPGWRAAIHGIAWFVVPILRFRTSRRKTPEDGLTGLRAIFLYLVGSLFFFLLAFAYIAPWNSGRGRVIAAVVALVGAACVLATALLTRRPLIGETAERLATNYRARFFVGVGLAEIPALTGLCGSLIAQSLWVYLVGLSFALIGFGLIAPTRGNIERAQDDISGAGSALVLGEALLGATRPERQTAIHERGSTRVRIAAFLLLLASALLAFAIQAVRPSSDIGVIILPAFGLFTILTLVIVSMSVARGVAARRRRPPPPAPPAAGTE
jgi:hypothetical protein